MFSLGRLDEGPRDSCGCRSRTHEPRQWKFASLIVEAVAELPRRAALAVRADSGFLFGLCTYRIDSASTMSLFGRVEV